MLEVSERLKKITLSASHITVAEVYALYRVTYYMNAV